MKLMITAALSIVALSPCLDARSEGRTVTIPENVPAWNAADRETTRQWFLENEYGVRPPEAIKPEMSYETVSEDKVLEGTALTDTEYLPEPLAAITCDKSRLVPVVSIA